MKPNQWFIAVLAGAQLTTIAFAGDEATTTNNNADIQALKQQIQELGEKVRILERQRESDQDAAVTAAKAQPRLAVGADGVTFSSADTNFSLSLHGVLQVDSRTFPSGGSINGRDSFLIRRARPILQGTVYRDFDFMFTPEFGGSTPQILDAYVNYRYRPPLQLQAGKFKPLVGLEALQSESAISFNERSLTTDLVPYRDIGAELHGDVFGGVVNYAGGIFNGAPDDNTTTANSDYDNDKAFGGRLWVQPWVRSDVTALKCLGFGIGGSYEVDRALGAAATGLTPGYTTDGQQKFFTYTNGVAANGTHWRISPQGCYYYGPFGLLGEYVVSDQEVTRPAGGALPAASADLHNTAWEISGGWMLTGEAASYNGVTPRHPFDPRNGQWGAWQLVGRCAELNVDSAAFPVFANPATSASAAQAWSAGLNWYLNGNIRVNASFSRTTFTGGNGAGATVTKQPENAIFTRVQLAF